MCKLSLVRWYVYTLMFNRCKSRIKTYPPIDHKHCVYSLQGTGLSALNIPWFLSAKFIIFMASCGPKTVSGWYCRGGLLSEIMFQSFGAMCFFAFARSFCSKTYELKRLIHKRKTADSTELNTIKISSYTNMDFKNNLFVSFRSQVKLTTDDVYYKHQITAMHRLAHEAYVEKNALVFRNF